MLTDEGINQAPYDRFTLIHALAGVVARQAGISLELTFIAAIGWEFIEPKLKESNPEYFPNPSVDSTSNKVVDVLATLIGWTLGGAL